MKDFGYSILGLGLVTLTLLAEENGSAYALGVAVLSAIVVGSIAYKFVKQSLDN